MLLPRDVDSLEDVPLDLLRAISHANRILDWHENLVEDELPPEWMWPFEDRLTEWFEDIKAEREAKRSRPADEETSVPLMSNELARGRR